MTFLPSLLLTIAGLGCLGLSLHRHAGQAGIGKQMPARLRPAGWGLLVLSLAAAVTTGNWRIALVEWIGQAGLAAAVIVLLLIYRPRALPRAVLIAGVCGAGALVAVR